MMLFISEKEPKEEHSAGLLPSSSVTMDLKRKVQVGSRISRANAFCFFF
jgi:hypothetical protein